MNLFDDLGVPEPTAKKRGPKTGVKQPEAIIQDSITAMLKIKDWGVFSTHGNIYQMGFPDLYCIHKRFGTRWVEVKNPIGYRFTPAQMDVFPEFSAKGVGIWILTAASEYEYQKLFKPANWWTFLSVMK
jgi:hypothetical protein